MASLWKNKLPITVFFILSYSFLVAGVPWLPFFGDPRLEVIASLTPSSTTNDTLTLRGRVLLEGIPQKDATVFAIVKHRYGQWIPDPASTSTDPKGSFLIDKIPRQLNEEDVIQVKVTATSTSERAGILRWLPSSKMTGEETLGIKCGPRVYRIIDAPFRNWAFLPIIFFLSIFVAYHGPTEEWQYRYSIALAGLFTAAMIAALAIGQGYVTARGDANDILSLGSASMFKGTYVDGIAQEWLFSFTSPPDKTCSQSPSQPTKGFGAPLWVLFLAVLGSGILTISLIVNEIKDRWDSAKKDEAYQRLEKFVRHQFLILFAPLGAIFVYQLLVGADAARNPLTVALAALGAGASLNLLLDKAIQSARGWLENKPKNGVSSKP